MKHKMSSLLLTGSLLLSLLAGCGQASSPAAADDAAGKSTANKGKIILATTTSTQDSGLLDYILPDFTEKTGWNVDTIAVGTGAALQMGRDGEADVLLVHAKKDEVKLVADGYGVKRYDVMYNDFVVVGPKDGAVKPNADVEQTFYKIADSKLPFISRGDDSGTNKKELSIWKTLHIDPKTLTGYESTGQGMGATLAVAAQKDGYCLSDRATWLTFADKGALDIVCEKSEALLNYYGVIAVTPTLNDKINQQGAEDFVNWIVSDDTQKLIGNYGVEKYGQSLFTPNAQANK